MENNFDDNKKYHKLVRDKIPEIIKSNNEEPITKILDDVEYKQELERKLKEELNETLESSGNDKIEELADMLEVMINLAKLEEKDLDDIINVCDEKRKKRGGFERRIYLSGVKKIKRYYPKATSKIIIIEKPIKVNKAIRSFLLFV